MRTSSIPRFYKSCLWCAHRTTIDGYMACELHAVRAYECSDFKIVGGFSIPEENKIGKWLPYDHDIFGCRQIDSICSVCGHLEYTAGHECKLKKCPNCEAKMGGE